MHLDSFHIFSYLLESIEKQILNVNKRIFFSINNERCKSNNNKAPKQQLNNEISFDINNCNSFNCVFEKMKFRSEKIFQLLKNRLI